MTVWSPYAGLVYVVRNPNYSVRSKELVMEGLVNMRLCADCKVDIDMEVPNDCGWGKHKWHYPLVEDSDMCCTCGLDWDVFYK